MTDRAVWKSPSHYDPELEPELMYRFCDLLTDDTAVLLGWLKQ